jgi:pimeloyl-ACP methyl ester carboxylesterase
MARWFAFFERPLVFRAFIAAAAVMPHALRRMIVGYVYRTLVFRDPAAMPDDAVRMFTSHLRDRATALRLLAMLNPLMREVRHFELDRIRRPLLLVWGSHDRLALASSAPRMLAAMPGSRLELIRGCGHCPQLEVPDRFVRAIVDFADEAVLERSVVR